MHASKHTLLVWTGRLPCESCWASSARCGSRACDMLARVDIPICKPVLKFEVLGVCVVPASSLLSVQRTHHLPAGSGIRGEHTGAFT